MVGLLGLSPQAGSTIHTRCHLTWSALAVLLGALPAATARATSLEVYGRLPQLEDVALSPDGSKIAFVRTKNDSRLVVIMALASRKPVDVLNVGDEKLRSIAWADDQNLLLTTSITTLPWGFIGTEREWYMLRAYNVKDRRAQVVPRPLNSDTHVMNVTSGQVMMRRVRGHTVLFVPGYYLAPTGFSLTRLPALFRYDLVTGREQLVLRGSPDTQSWLVDRDGEVVAEEDYDEQAQRWSLKIRRGERLEEVVSGHASIDFPRLLGFGPTGDTLLVQSIEGGDSVWRLLFTATGAFGPPMAERRTLDAPIADGLTYRLIGGMHIDDEAHYVFFDSIMQARWQSILNAFPGERVRYVSCSADFRKIIVRVDGPRDGFRYMLVDLGTGQAQPLGDVYEGLTQPLQASRITYPAADGLAIPAYLTLPRGKPPRGLPLIVLPHGGPADRDTADFDWWSQALADQGYAVLRPNYRGSTLSARFLAAGFGEWGRKMQTDLSDGVRYLVKLGVADPARVCIVGASYGGYAALAGVALQTGVYRCAVSVGGISDLKGMLLWTDRSTDTGNKIAVRFWDRFWGATGPEDPVLERLSPDAHAEAVDVPVLLIHGRDDTVVPYEQSQLMFQALRRVHKSVELVTLKHEDHWLSRSETRLQMLEASVAFLRTYDPP
jgi:dipeptidyl aminopeptidase/acylaminoacyl peptidase